MLKLFCVICVAIGSVIMAHNIFKYSKSVIRANSIQKKSSYYRHTSYTISLGLMCFFLLGYLFTGLMMLLSKNITLSNLVIALVFLFGAVFVDIMINVQTQMVSLYAKEVLRTITDNIDNMIHVVDPSTFEILFVNLALAEHNDKHPAELIGKTCWKAIKSSKKESCPNCPATLLKQQAQGKDIAMHWENQDDSGKIFFVTSTFIQWIDGRKVLMCNSIDITERKKQEINLQICATTDRLTGAYNRTWGHQLLDSMFQPGATPSLPITFCFLDLDELKTINDKHGHSAGDKLLCKFVNSIQQNIRQQDSLIRWGGDEFVLILHCDVAGAESVIQKTQKYINKQNQLSAKEFQIHFSYGIEQMVVGPDIRWEALISSADMKMYQHKISKKSEPSVLPAE